MTEATCQCWARVRRSSARSVSLNTLLLIFSFYLQVSLQGTEYSEVLVRRLEDTSHSGAEAVSWAGGLLLAALCVILL